ncbi:sensor histidine kinase [Actinomadura xylanilytica]|uniref:sensor histidine kinase n=1 Tax=Actinomadura xylanilytica TaxID=887459 RepID=UPI00255A90AA|nr:sensor histidine kinase [Actinomadura xylanilytica]MDL4775670.1 sensor histidine kinase [Actinomadura xylanilytica]
MNAFTGTGIPAAPADPARAATDRGGLTHQALLYRSDRDFAAAAVPFLRDGRLAGDVLVVIASAAARCLLREQLGAADAARIEFIDRAEWFRGPMQALASYHDRARGDWWPRGRLRLLAEPVWTGRTPLETCEWKRHEAVLNVVFAGTPTALMCAYDATALPGHVLFDAARTHPELVDGDGVRQSGSFTDPAAFYAECNGRPLPRPPDTAARRGFAGGELPGLRSFLMVEAARHGLARDRTLPFVLAANEVATHVIRHGGGEGVLWVWAEDGELVCDVDDPKGELEDRFLGYAPPRSDRSGDGAMWAVRRLCHIVEIRSGAGGSSIRLHQRLGDDG